MLVVIVTNSYPIFYIWTRLPLIFELRVHRALSLFRLTAPSEEEIRRFISDQTRSTLSYPEVGASASEAPSGYNIDHHRVQLGRGEAAWRQAVEAIRGWRMFSMSWVQLYWPTAPIEVGTDVAISVLHFGFYSLNACRIVYVVDENGPIKRYGFAYGTLQEHAESGEERFTIEMESNPKIK